MHGFWLFIHVLGIVLWIGGGLATMVAGVAAKQFPPETRLAAYRLTSAVQRVLVGPGAVAVLVSGVVLTMRYMRVGAIPGWLALMMATGIPAAAVALGVALPTAARLGRLELDVQGGLPSPFAALRLRLIQTASIAGGLGLIALVAGTIFRN
jgi:hypothetical protein